MTSRPPRPPLPSFRPARRYGVLGRGLPAVSLQPVGTDATGPQHAQALLPPIPASGPSSIALVSHAIPRQRLSHLFGRPATCPCQPDENTQPCAAARASKRGPSRPAHLPVTSVLHLRANQLRRRGHHDFYATVSGVRPRPKVDLIHRNIKNPLYFKKYGINCMVLQKFGAAGASLLSVVFQPLVQVPSQGWALQVPL